MNINDIPLDKIEFNKIAVSKANCHQIMNATLTSNNKFQNES